MNIQFCYLYRDAGNYKLFDHIVFSNRKDYTISQIEQKIRSLLISETYFSPEQWNIPRLKFDRFDPKLDHEWHEFEMVDYTEESATMEQDIKEFLESVINSTEGTRLL